ncbi:MAG: hypothetical protein Q9218_004782 [Villophora microphyllina]
MEEGVSVGEKSSHRASQERGITSPTTPASNEKHHEDGPEDNSNQRLPRSTFLSPLKWAILCSSMLVAEVQAALDSTITADLQPTIINSLGEISKFPWINVSYSLGLGGSCLLWGKLLVVFDSKNILLIARVLFAIGSALTAAAPSMNALIVGKVITGIGSSGTYIAVIAIITALTSAEEQGRYFGYIGFMWGLGTIIGPPFGGAFAVTAAGWRWSFYFNLILVGITFPIFVLLLPSRKGPSPQKGLWRRIGRIDAIGSLLFAGALFSGVMALSFAGAVYPWSSGRIIALFCCSGILWILFVVQQATTTFTTTANRILPIHILLSWEMWILIIQTGCSISMLFITIFYIPLYFQFIRGESALRAAVDLLPFLFTSVSAMLISGRLMTSIGYYKLWFIAGSSLALIMAVMLYTTGIDTSHGHIYGYLILGGLGTGLYAMNSGPVMSAIVAKEHIGDASTIFGCIDTICGAVSVAVANCIFINRATDGIQGVLPNTPRAAVQEAISGVGASLTNQLPPPTRVAVLQAEMDAIKDVWVQMIATAKNILVDQIKRESRKEGHNLSRLLRQRPTSHGYPRYASTVTTRKGQMVTRNQENPV